jgi:hypothetical protein
VAIPVVIPDWDFLFTAARDASIAEQKSPTKIKKNRNDLVRGALAPRGSDPKHPLPSEASALSQLPLVGRATTVHFTGGGSGQPMQIAAKREGNTPFISPELDPTPHVLASTTITRSSSG